MLSILEILKIEYYFFRASYAIDKYVVYVYFKLSIKCLKSFINLKIFNGLKKD